MSTDDSTFDSFAPAVGRGFVEQRCATTGATANALSSHSRAGTCMHTDSAVLTERAFTHALTKFHRAMPRRGTRPAQCHAAYLLSGATTPERHRLHRRRKKKKSLTSQLLPRRKSFVSFALP